MKRNLFLIAALLFVCTSLFAQKKAFTIEDLYKAKKVASPVVSPSGNKTAFTVTDYNLKEGKSNTDIYILYKDGATENISSKDVSETNPFWSSDSELYFLEDSQVYSFNFNNRKTEKVTDFATGVSDPMLSPDKKFIVFVSNVFPQCGADNFCNKNLLESSEKGPVQAYMTDNLMFRHWTEYSGEKKTSLILYNIDRIIINCLHKANYFLLILCSVELLSLAFLPIAKKYVMFSIPIWTSPLPQIPTLWLYI